jgi:hypothetical protein
VFWTLLAFVGAVFSAINVGSAWGDWKFLKAQKIVNGRAYLARNALITEIGRLYIQNVFVMIGMLAMFLENPPTHVVSLKLRLFSALFQWGLISSSAVLTFKSYLLYKTRKVVTNGHIKEVE